MSLDRRSVLIALGLAPAAMVLGPNVAWALTNRVDIRIRDGYRVIDANGIPDHATGRFPNSGNPNAISEQSHHFRVPERPRENADLTAYFLGSFGVALNGVPFDPFTAEFHNRDPKSGWRFEAMTGKTNLGLDDSNAHVQPNGSYHYHGIPRGLIKRWSPDSHSALVGYAADGFPIYVAYGHSDPLDAHSPIRALTSGWRMRQGRRDSGPGGPFDGTYVEDFIYEPGNGDLDKANGRFAVTPDYPEGTYAYFLTDTFPYIPRYFRGRPDPSFRVRFDLPDRLPGPPGGGMGGGFGGPSGGPSGGGGFRPPPPGGRPPPRW